MISWIQRTFQRHFRWVFFLVLAAMAIPLIVIFSPSSGGRVANKVLERPFFGINLENPEQARRMFADGSLSVLFKAGYNEIEGGQLQQYALQRVAGLALADDLHLPQPTADQIAAYVPSLRKFQDQKGQFDQKSYLAYGDSLKTGGQITVADVNRVLRDDTRLAQLSKIVGGPGYVRPHDIRENLIRSDSIWTVQVATLDYAGFNPDLNATEDTLKKFHEENSFRYEVPARPRFSYVEFKWAKFPPATRPTEAEVRSFYEANPASFPVPAEPDKKDAAAPPKAAASPADNFQKVRAQVEAAMISRVSSRIAAKAANELTVTLYERKLTANSPELAAFLATLPMPVVAVAPFAPDSPAPDKPWLGAYTEQIMHLTKDRFFSDPLPTADSFVVLLWNDNLPAYKPLFSEVRDRVAADFKDGEKRRLFNQRGRALRAQLLAAAKTATGFASAAAAEKLEVKTYANFTPRQPPPDMPSQAFSALRGLEAGQVSEMSATADKGYLVYVQEKKLPDLSPTSPRYAELQKQLMLFTAGNNENAYYGELIERELRKSEPVAKP